MCGSIFFTRLFNMREIVTLQKLLNSVQLVTQTHNMIESMLHIL